MQKTMPSDENPRPVPRRPNAEEVVPELALMAIDDVLFIPNARGSGNPPIGATSVAVYGHRTGRGFDLQYENEGLRVRRVK